MRDRLTIRQLGDMADMVDDGELVVRLRNADGASWTGLVTGMSLSCVDGKWEMVVEAEVEE